MKKNIYVIILFIILFGIFFFRVTTSYRMPPIYNYDADFGRDLMMMQQINQGKLTLVGPQFNFSGLRLSPYHFYFFAPFLKIYNDYRQVVYANATFFTLGFLFLFYYLAKKTDIQNAFLFILFLVTTPYLILAGRSPGNAFSYLIFLVIYLFILFFEIKFNYKNSIILGLVAGVMINYHPVSGIVVFLSFIGSWYLSQGKIKNKIVYLFIFIVCLILTFTPFLLFEIRHGFLITKGVLVGKTTSQFGLKNIIEINSVSRNFFWMGLMGFFVLLSVSLVKLFNKKNLVWYLICIICLVSLLLYGQPVAHYVFPTLLLMQTIFIFYIYKTKYLKPIMIFLIIANIFTFPKQLYYQARNLGKIEKIVKDVIVKHKLPKKNLNIILVNDTYLSVVGYEYRYLLTKYGFWFNDEFSYSSSNKLLLISEKGNIDWKKLATWEIKQFGNKKMVKQFCQETTCFYLFEKDKN